MLIPFDMIAAMMFLGYYFEARVARLPSLAWSLGLLAGVGLATAIAAAMVNFVTLRLLRRRRQLSQRRHLAGLADLALRGLLFAGYVTALELSAFPWSVDAALGRSDAGESFLMQLFGLLPYLLLFFCAWLPMYGLHRETSYGAWTRWSFLVHKARYNLFLLLAWLPFALLTEWLSGFMAWLPLLFLLSAWTFPLLLAKAWGCRRLPDGETMDMVRRLEKTAGAKFSRVYLWEPGGGNTQNAAAVGILRPFRYLFLTPALIRSMQPAELEAVILHELGHVKKRHLLFYLFSSLAGINLAVLAGAAMPSLTGTERFIVSGVLILGYFRLVFGWLSRHMERQADIFALEKSGGADGLVNALEKLGLAAGGIRLAASWHHLGIAERVDFLRRADRRRELVRWHHARVASIMVAGYLVSFLTIGFMGLALHEEYGRPAAPAAAAIAGEDMAHWRRVMAIMPGNPTAPLELAYRLAGNPKNRDLAVNMADKAMRLSCGGEEKKAAAKLIADLGGVPAEDAGDAGKCN